MIDKGRLMAITDGIVAIAATIMVLQLVVPEKFDMKAVYDQLPTMIAYIISFVQVFLAWHEHHDSFAYAEKINHRIFLLNCLWLFFVTLLPFATRVIGNSHGHTPSVLLYIGVLIMVQLTITIESRSIRKLNKTPILDEEIIKKIRMISIAGYLISALFAFFKPFIALLMILLLTVIEIILICLYDRKIAKYID